MKVSTNRIIWRKAGFITCLFCFLWLKLPGQDKEARRDFSEELEKAYHFTLNFKIKESRNLLAAYADSSSYAWQYLHHLNDALEIFITEDAGLWGGFVDRTQIIEKGPESQWKGFYLAEMALHKMIIHLKFGEELSAAWQFRQAYRYSVKNDEVYPDFIFNKKSLGLEHVIIGSTPDKYQWILSLLGFEGTVEDGFQELQDFSQFQSPYQLETNILLSFINSYILQDHQSGLDRLKPHLSNIPGHLLVNYTYTSILIKNGNSLRALEILTDLENDGKTSFPFFLYQKGNIFLLKGDYAKAEYTLKEFLLAHHGHNYVKDSYFKIGLSYWLRSMDDEAATMFDEARKSGLTLTEADKYASSTLRGGLSDRRIYRIRLLTDGGFYTEAQQQVDQVSTKDFSNDRDKVEFIYRKARLSHLSGNSSLSIPLYQSTIEETDLVDGKWYFAPNSALQLGYIYSEKGELESAKQHFILAMSYKKHPYKNSIDNKAKAALAHLELR